MHHLFDALQRWWKEQSPPPKPVEQAIQELEETDRELEQRIRSLRASVMAQSQGRVPWGNDRE